MTDQHSPSEDPQSQVPGNVWGWRFSFISLAIILALLTLVLFRWYQLGKPSMKGLPATEEVTLDSTQMQKDSEMVE